MTPPVALVYYQNLLAGGQLVNGLQDLGYRVHLVTDLNSIVDQALAAKPLLFVTDFETAASPVAGAIRALRNRRETTHIPVLAFVKEDDKKLADAARIAGVTLAASGAGILTQLPALLDQTLHLE